MGKTLKAFDEILALDPQDTLASIMKAFSLIRLQEFEKAVTVLKELTTDEINSVCLLACLALPISGLKISKELSKRTERQSM